MKKQSKRSILILIFLFIGVNANFFVMPDCYGGSFYSSIGLGIPRIFVSSQSAGMGGAGVAVFDPLSINRLNPAALETFGLTRVSVDFDMESLNAKHTLGTVNSKYANANGFNFLVPIMKNVSVGLGVGLVSDSKYSLLIEEDSLDYAYKRRVDANGGLGQGGFSLFFKPMKWLQLGLSTQFNFGKFEEDWETDFISDKYVDATDEISTHMDGMNWRFGVLVKPNRNLNIGVVYASEAKLSAQTKLRQESGAEKEWLDQKISFPKLLSLGASYRFKDRIQLAADYTTQNWSSFGKEGKLEDLQRYAFGLEYVPSTDMMAKYMSRICYRLGTFHTQLYILDSHGNPLTETFVTLGLGFPFYGGNGRLDFGLQLGKRGNLSNNPYEEKIIRFVAGLTGAEKWFVRRH